MRQIIAQPDILSYLRIHTQQKVTLEDKLESEEKPSLLSKLKVLLRTFGGTRTFHKEEQQGKIKDLQERIAIERVILEVADKKKDRLYLSEFFSSNLNSKELGELLYIIAQLIEIIRNAGEHVDSSLLDKLDMLQLIKTDKIKNLTDGGLQNEIKKLEDSLRRSEKIDHIVANKLEILRREKIIRTIVLLGRNRKNILAKQVEKIQNLIKDFQEDLHEHIQILDNPLFKWGIIRWFNDKFHIVTKKDEEEIKQQIQEIKKNLKESQEYFAALLQMQEMIQNPDKELAHRISENDKCIESLKQFKQKYKLGQIQEIPEMSCEYYDQASYLERRFQALNTIETYFTRGRASAEGNNCLIDTLYQLSHRGQKASSTQLNYIRHQLLVSQNISLFGEMVDFYGPDGIALINYFRIPIIIIQIDHQGNILYHPLRIPENPLPGSHPFFILHHGLHFEPLWLKENLVHTDFESTFSKFNK